MSSLYPQTPCHHYVSFVAFLNMDPVTVPFFIVVALRVLFTLFIVGVFYEVTEQNDDDDDFDGGTLQPVYVKNR